MASDQTTESNSAESTTDLFSNTDSASASEAAEARVAPRAAVPLFQAPDLSALRPVKKAKPAPVDEVDDDDEDETSEDDDQTTDSTSSDDDGEQQSTGKKRRRRGGRGRGRSGANASEGGDDSSSDDDDDDSPSNKDSSPSKPKGNKGGKGKSKHKDADDADAQSTDDKSSDSDDDADGDDDGDQSSSTRRRRRRRRSGSGSGSGSGDGSNSSGDEVTALKGSTRLEAKRQRRREGRDAGRKRQIITEAEFLARRESVKREMVVRELDGRTQIAVLEDDVLVEHYVSQQQQLSLAGNVYLGRVQNVLPSMEAAFVDIGKGRNAVLYAGEVNWDAAGLDGQPRRIEQALKSGDPVLVQVTKDPIGHKGARLTSQITLAGRYLVLVPGGGMTGISRKLPDNERTRLKNILRDIVPEGSGVIVRTAAEGASEEELAADIDRLQGQWAKIEKKQKSASAPALLQGEPDLAIKVVRDIFNDDFAKLTVAGDKAHKEITEYLGELAPDLASKVTKWVEPKDIFSAYRVDEQLAKGMDRKVWLPSGGSLVIDRTEAMTVVDVNTGKFTGSGGTLEETVTRNNLEAAEEIVRQLRLRDIGGIIVVDFIDMVLESNRDLVLRRLIECLGRDRTRHQVAEVTSLGLVQMTRKRVGQGLVEAFSENCSHCNGRGFIVHSSPVEKGGQRQNDGGGNNSDGGGSRRSRKNRGGNTSGGNNGGSGNDNATSGDSTESAAPAVPVLPDPASEAREAVKATLAQIAAAAAHAHEAEGAAAETKGAPENTGPKTLDDIVLDDRSGKSQKPDAVEPEPEPEPGADASVEAEAEPQADAVVSDAVVAEPAQQPQSQRKTRRRRATRPQAMPAVPPPPPSDNE